MRLRNSLFALAMAVAPAALYATPRILVQDPPEAAIIITSNSFTFSADALGGGVLSFRNESGSDWHSLTVTATLPISTQITVGPGPFVTDTVSVTPVTSGFFYTILFGPTVTGGIPDNTNFLINLDSAGNDPNGPGEWGPGRDFSATVNTPEPASSILFLAGALLVAGVFRYRRRTV